MPGASAEALGAPGACSRLSRRGLRNRRRSLRPRAAPRNVPARLFSARLGGTQRRARHVRKVAKDAVDAQRGELRVFLLWVSLIGWREEPGFAAKRPDVHEEARPTERLQARRL